MQDDESSVLDKFRQGDAEAFETLFRMHQRSVFGWVLRIVREPGAAEDVTVEAFWRIHQAHARFDSLREFEPWARRIATHAALDWLRRQKPEAGMTPERWNSVASPENPDAAVNAEIRMKTAQAFCALATEITRHRGFGISRRASAKRGSRGAGNYGDSGEAQGISCPSLVEKRFNRNGDQTMTKCRLQETGNSEQEAARIARLLRESLPPVGNAVEPERDFWPAMLRRMEAKTVGDPTSIPWFDWALAAGLVAFAAIAPRTIPVMLYYL